MPGNLQTDTSKACSHKLSFLVKSSALNWSGRFFSSRINWCWAGNETHFMRSVGFYSSLWVLLSFHPQGTTGSVSVANINPQQHSRVVGGSSSISHFPCLSTGCSQFKITSHFLLSALNCWIQQPWRTRPCLENLSVLPLFSEQGGKVSPSEAASKELSCV